MNVLINFLVFQAAWFSTVLGAAKGAPWLGPVAILVAVALHLRFTRRPGVELRLLAIAMVLGLTVDSLLLATGWIAYPNGAWLPGFAPYWIIAMWALFATTLNVSMRWLKDRYLLAAVFGAVGGPLSYLAGARLGAMNFVQAEWALLALAIAWGVSMPLLTALSSRFDGTRAAASPVVAPGNFARIDSHV